MPRSYNNPGALRLASGPYRRFHTLADGMEALYSNIEAWRHRGKTWREIIRLWSEVPDKYEAAIAPRFRTCLATR